MLPLAIGGVIAKVGGIGGVVKNVGKTIGKALGLGGPSNTNPAARQLQTDLSPQLVNVLSVGYAKGKTDPGTYLLDVRNGNVYQSKADGIHAINTPWSRGITIDWVTKNAFNTHKLSNALEPSSAEAAAKAGIGPGLLIAAVVGIGIVVLVGLKK